MAIWVALSEGVVVGTEKQHLLQHQGHWKSHQQWNSSGVGMVKEKWLESLVVEKLFSRIPVLRFILQLLYK